MPRGFKTSLSTAVSDWDEHEVCPRDKAIIAAGFTAFNKASEASAGPRAKAGLEAALSRLPCDILRAPRTPCPQPPPRSPPL